MSDFYDSAETRNPDQRQAELLAAINAQLNHAKAKTSHYADLFQDAPNALTSLNDLALLPLTRKSELLSAQQAKSPFGGLISVEQPRYVFASPGPIYEISSGRNDYWRFARCLYAAGFRSKDLVLSCFSYHLTPAGNMVDSGAHALGCSVIPAGPGQTDVQLQTIADLKPSAYVGTPSFLKIILEKALEQNIDVSSISKALVSGEAFPPSLRDFFAEHGIAATQAYATADLGLIAYESSAQSQLIIDEGVYVEIVRPGSGDPVADGEVGEVVVTTLNPDYPLIRFATGDLSAFAEGTSACGRSNKRIKGWMGRADQTTKVRGMFVHPQQVQRVAARHDELAKVRLVVQWQEQDQMTLRCECTNPSEELALAVSASIRDVLKLRGEVEWVSLGGLPNDGIVIDDARVYE